MAQRLLAFLSGVGLALGAAAPAFGFCGFYVAKADTDLFNEASKVVLVRDGDRTVLTMANNYKGEPKEFAIVIPVPTFIEREQIHVADRAVIEHLDAYSAPRLVEYFDRNPCAIQRRRKLAPIMGAAPTPNTETEERAKSLGVTIEAEYTVGEYDILILSAEESKGLETWLRENDYRIPKGASRVLGSYIKQDMRFFVAKVNLEKQSELGFSYLRPLQVAYETEKFMLPIRLGTLNADGPQELFVFTLTRKGRVETTNYRTVKLPSDKEIPIYVKDEFGKFYRAMFGEQVRREDMRAVFLEYAWDMNWCDPCAADPLSNDELRQLGVFWIQPGADPGSRRPQAKDVYVTRLHLRYTAETFPADLRFQQTGSRRNFQARYILRHPWTGDEQCEAADRYRRSLADRQERRIQTLASLTGWDVNEIRKKVPDAPAPTPTPWWEELWPND